MQPISNTFLLQDLVSRELMPLFKSAQSIGFQQGSSFQLSVCCQKLLVLCSCTLYLFSKQKGEAHQYPANLCIVSVSEQDTGLNGDFNNSYKAMQ